MIYDQNENRKKDCSRCQIWFEYLCFIFYLKLSNNFPKEKKGIV